MFSLQGSGAADFGIAVHRLLAEVEWIAGDAIAQHAEAWRAREVPADVREEALACLREPALRDVWRSPATPAEVWRERAFEVVIDGAWVTGVFDRVVIERAANGRAVRATVLDFKTDRAAEAELGALVARHAPQLNLYRRVVAVLAGVAVADVEAVLVFTRSRRLVVVPGGG